MSLHPTNYIKGSIRWKLLTMTLGLIITLLMTLTIIQIAAEKKILEQEISRRIVLMKENLIHRGKALSENLASQAKNDIAAFNFSNLTETIPKAVAQTPELDYAILMTASGVVRVHTRDPKLQGEKLAAPADLFALRQQQPIFKEYQDIMEFIQPILFGTESWGALRLGFSLAALNGEIERSWQEIRKQTQELVLNAFLTLLVFIAVGSVSVLFISTSLSRPLIELMQSAREVAKGNFDAANNITIKPSGEIGLLALAFVEMAKDLKVSQARLAENSHTLEQKVKERTLELEVAYERLQEIDKIKSDFLSTISHELRTPLTSVMGFAKIIDKKLHANIFPLLQDVDDKKVQRAIRQIGGNMGIIVAEGERLTTLINDVLDLAKLESGKIAWQTHDLYISQIVERAIAATAALITQKPVVISSTIDPNLPIVQGDHDRFLQVVINLLSNAIKFTEQGTITCTASNQGTNLAIRVSDTGIGIPEEERNTVFDRFKQVGDTLTDKPKGTGLGLPICKEIVEHHGGTLWASANAPHGSVFSFTIPIHRGDLHG